MLINGQHFRSLWPDASQQFVECIDQTHLPFSFKITRMQHVADMVHAIKTMQVRGAPLIGAAAAYGVALAVNQQQTDVHLLAAIGQLKQARPTAVNLAWALQRMQNVLLAADSQQRIALAWAEAANIADEDVLQNQAIGQHGLSLIQAFARKAKDNKSVINVLTHCNAGWLATVDHGTALAPIYAAHDAGLPVHVWVDETRPRNQGASLTAWELCQHGVPHTVISDNAGGHLMQHGQVDLVIVGADRVTRTGDVCNKIGTYLKALAAFDNQIPFYAAVPSPTIDWTIADGLAEIDIEERDADEVAYMQGLTKDGRLETVRVMPLTSPAANPAFDVTPARLVTGIITEQGIFTPDELQAQHQLQALR
ncbi:MAG TPA: S-methyl-5-thioribose-1-phosphate isomerase [Methylophilus sp.]